MSRINALNTTQATGRNLENFNAIKAKFGKVPNMMATMAVSPAVLESYLKLSGTLSETLDAREREQIALAVAEVNNCEYCASAHSVIGKMVGLSPDAIREAREGTAATAREKAIIELAVAIAKDRGHISDLQFEAARAAGLTDAAIAEVVANVALNTFTNFFNSVAETENDFPKAEPVSKSISCAC